MKRDFIKNDEYWQTRLKKSTARIERIEGWVKEEQDEKKLRELKYLLEINRFRHVITMYSAGEMLSDCHQIFEKNVENMCEIWDETNGYNLLLWYISLGYLFGVDEDTVRCLCLMYTKSNMKDQLIEMILSQMDPAVVVTNHFEDGEIERNLTEVITCEKTKKADCILKYLTKTWYKSHKDAPWYNSDKMKNDSYYGYWSFETGALIKLFDIEDGILKGVKYYPYDLVHYSK